MEKTDEKTTIEQAFVKCTADTAADVMADLLLDTNISTHDMYRDLYYEYTEAETDEYRRGLDAALKILTECDLTEIAQQILDRTAETDRSKGMSGEVLIKEAEAIYTGGNIWVFTGTTQEEGVYFLTSDDGWTLLLNANPSEDFEESGYPEWQQAHLIRELEGEELGRFNRRMLKILKNYSHNDERRGGITDEELEGYPKYWFKECDEQ
jgi:hypothetical protein